MADLMDSSDWVSDWITNESGQKIQKRVFEEVSRKLEEIEPGCVSRVISAWMDKCCYPGHPPYLVFLRI
jgi:hypothetical protein